MATIATHNGTQIARQHNLRNPKVVSKEPHIDINGISEIWLDEQPRKAYERLFGEAVRKYNAKQKRSDRKIADYYKKICEDRKKHYAYEMIVGVYDKDIPIETKREILKEFADGWNERNPNLELIGLYFHADEEGDVHLHIDYIPVARGCKRGLETQTALVKALEQQGIEAGQTMKETCQILWEAKENQHLESLCAARGISIEHPMRDGEKSAHHLETEIFKLEKQKEQLQIENEQLQGEAEQLQVENEQLKSAFSTLSQKVEGLQNEVSKWSAKKDLTMREVKSAEKKMEEIKDQIKEAEKITSAPLDPLARFIDYIRRSNKPLATKNFVVRLVKEFQEWEQKIYKKIKSWNPPQKGKDKNMDLDR